jgi:hypothetical protein
MTDNAEFPEVLNLKLRETTLSFKKWDPNYGNHIPGIYHYYSATPTNSEWTIDVDFCKNKYVKGEWRASTYWTEASNDDSTRGVRRKDKRY